MFYGIVIAILAIIQALSGSPHLFQRPLKLWKFAIIAAIILFCGLSTWDSWNTGRAQEKSRSTIDSLKGASGVLQKSIDTLRYENRVDRDEDRQQRFKDHLTIIDQLARYGLKIDSVNNRIIQTEILPTLDILNAPILSINKNGKRKLKAEICSYTANAHIVNDCIITLQKIGGSSDSEVYGNVQKFHIANFNKSSILPKESKYYCGFDIHDEIINKNKIIVVFEILYASDKGQIQPPMIKIYQVDQSHVYSLSSTEYSSVYKFLSKHNLIITNDGKD